MVRIIFNEDEDEMRIKAKMLYALLILLIRDLKAS